MRAQEDEPANPHSLRAMWGERIGVLAMLIDRGNAPTDTRVKRMNRRIRTRCERCGKRGNQRITRRAPLALLAMLIDQGNVRRPMRVQRGRTGESALAASDVGERIGVLTALIDRGNARRPMRVQEDEPANPHSLRAMWEEGETGESRAPPRLRFLPRSSTEETRADRCAYKEDEPANPHCRARRGKTALGRLKRKWCLQTARAVV